MKFKHLLSLLPLILITVSPVAAGNLKWNGYFNWSLSDDSRPSSNSSFDAFALSLIPQMEINDRATLYSQIVFEHGTFFEPSIDATGNRTWDKRSSGEFTLDDAYLKLDLNDNMDLRFGKFTTPFGIWNTAQYADSTYLTARLPGRDSIYSRGAEPRTDTYLFSRRTMGVWARGRWRNFDGDLYVTNGRTQLAQHVDDNNNKGLGVRVTTKAKAPGFQKLNILYSGYQDTTSTDTVSTEFQENRTHALSVDAQAGPWILMSEYGNGTRGAVHTEAFYALVGFSVRDRWIPFVRHEIFEPNRRAGSDRTYVTGAGVRFNMNPEEFYGVNFKIQLDRMASEITTKDQNYNRFFATVGTSF